MRNFLLLLVFIFSISTVLNAKDKPNIIIIYADDLGYGDLSCYGAAELSTPNIDRLASTGIKFTDGHCSASTCTPSRYTLLTGEYAFRGKARILRGDAPLIIDTNKKTLPAMLQNAGYKTGIVGKWHLGLGNGDLNWNEEIKPGPIEVGFDYSYIIPATGDRVPCVFMENHRVENLDPKDPITVSYRNNVGNGPTGKENPELLKLVHSHGHNNTIINGIGRIGYMTGGKSALWKDEDFADILSKKATTFIEENKDDPFFLYFSFHDIHVPRIPHPRFVGSTNMGARGDVIVQMDWCVGEVMNKLKELGLDDNTLVIFSSDNGPVLDDGYKDEAVTSLGDHKPAGPFRGGKYSSFEGGTRVPFIVTWPNKVSPGESSAVISQVDLFASLASLTGQKLKNDDAVDSYNLISELLGSSTNGRDVLIEESGRYGVRKGDWKYIEGTKTKKRTVSPLLFNLSIDESEQNNVLSENTQKAAELKLILDDLRKNSGTRPTLKN